VRQRFAAHVPELAPGYAGKVRRMQGQPVPSDP